MDDADIHLSRSLYFQIFVGSGVGAPFGPRCHKGDTMGCGVLFPRNYECKSDSEEELEQQAGAGDGDAAAGYFGAGVRPAGIHDDVQGTDGRKNRRALRKATELLGFVYGTGLFM